MNTKTLSTLSPPESGQLVEVRRHRYAVVEVQAGALPPSGEAGELVRAQHLVTLSSVEDDAFGEELRVVWELEPGARAFERTDLPEVDGFDEPAQLETFLDAVRWGAIASANTRHLQAPFRSGIRIEDYQLDPVIRALRMPRANLLIADDVGMGKTIEAGLVVQELLLRHRARTVVVVCPASLQVQWREQMRDKFGLEFRIVDSELLRRLRRTRGLHVNPWSHFPRLITSMDFLKRERPLRLFRELLPAPGEPEFPRRFDLLIVDEAHNVAPAGAGKYATDSDRTRAVRALAPHFEHRLFLSATPHNGYKESFSALLELVDNQRFARGLVPDPAQLAAVMVRRLKRELPPDWTGRARFPERVLASLEVEYPETERRAHAALVEYSRLRRERLADEREQFALEFVLKLLKKRLFSSPAAFESTLACHLRSLRAGDRTAPPSLALLQRQADRAEEEFGDDGDYADAEEEALEASGQALRPPDADQERLLAELTEWARAAAARPDARAGVLLRWLKETLVPGGDWNDERVLLFTEYRDTQKWLYDLLAAQGLAREGRLLTLFGGMQTDERERIKAAFQAAPEVSPVRILLATDAASEGIDLQNHCSRLVHYEIPWSPTRLEQRNGRLDRHGQRAAEVRVYHFVPQGFDLASPEGRPPGELEGDLEFLARVARKVDTIREDLGKVGPVLALQVQEAMVGKRRRLDTQRAEQEAEPARRVLGLERNLREQIARCHEQLQETRRELHLTPDRVQRVVELGLALAGQPGLRPARPDEVEGLRSGVEAFHLPPLTGSWAECSLGLRHPHTGQLRPLVFDAEAAEGRDDLVAAHLNHRLVQMCLRLLRAEVWSTGPGRRLHRVAAVRLRAPALEVPVVVAHARLVVLGADQHRLHEELLAAGGAVRAGRFQRLNQSELERALGAERTGPASEQAHTEFRRLWAGLRGPLRQALEARMRDRTDSLRHTLQTRGEQEAGDLERLLRELERTLREELAGPVQLELSLFTDTERAQVERNRDALAERLQRIPREIEQETAALRARYAEPSPRLFPVGVLFLLPERLDPGR